MLYCQKKWDFILTFLIVDIGKVVIYSIHELLEQEPGGCGSPEQSQLEETGLFKALDQLHVFQHVIASLIVQSYSLHI